MSDTKLTLDAIRTRIEEAVSSQGYDEVPSQKQVDLVAKYFFALGLDNIDDIESGEAYQLYYFVLLAEDEDWIEIR